MTRRSRAREVALQVLFQDDLQTEISPQFGEALVFARLYPFVGRVVQQARGLLETPEGDAEEAPEWTAAPREQLRAILDRLQSGTPEVRPGLLELDALLQRLQVHPEISPRRAERFRLLREEVQRSLPSADEVAEFARSLIAGVRRNRGEIDALLAQIADNWKLERMAVTDRNVLRLGGYEVLFTDTPGKVAIDEAVELAKRFGSAQSALFVNGILDKFLARRK